MTLQQQRTQEALRALPSAGWVGRRDRAVHVLSQMAGMSDEHIATLTAGDVVIADGAATITASTGTITLPASGDTLICGPCALARWLRVLDMTVTYRTDTSSTPSSHGPLRCPPTHRTCAAAPTRSPTRPGR